MYCKKCHNLIPENEKICPKCGFDNDHELDETKEIYIDQVLAKNNNINKAKSKSVVIALLFILIVSVISIYVVKDSKAIDSTNTTSKTTTEVPLILDKEFNFKDIKMRYPSNIFGTSRNTIFYKTNNAFNIEVKLLEENEYNDIINSSELLDSKLGNIETKTYASSNSYSHIFTYLENYYLITVNYVIDETLESTKIQLEIAKIINTLN